MQCTHDFVWVSQVLVAVRLQQLCVACMRPPRHRVHGGGPAGGDG